MPLGLSDQIAYNILTVKDVSISIDDNKLRQYWSNNKQNYMQPKKYFIEVLWTPTDNINITQEEIETFYKTNANKYTAQDGKQPPLETMIPFITKELRIQKAEKTAQRAYIDYKKAKIQANEKIETYTNDPKISPEIINEIDKLNDGEILKPRVIGDKYATIKLIKTINPEPMTFDEAKANLIQDYSKEAGKNALQILAQDNLKNFNAASAKYTRWVSLKAVTICCHLIKRKIYNFYKNYLHLRKKRV